MGMNWLALCGFFVFVTSLSASIFVLANNYKRKINISWAIFTFLVALWGFGVFKSFSALNKETALFWGRFHNLSALFIPPAFLQFVYVFLKKPQKNNFILFSYFLIVGYFIASVLSPLIFIADVAPKSGFRYYPVSGNLYFFFPIFFVLLVSIGIASLYQALKTAEGDARNKILYLLSGMFIGFMGGSTTFPLVFGIPIKPYGAWGVVLYIFIITYAITRHHLLDIEIVIKKTAFYSILTALLTAIFVVLIFVSQRLLSGLTGYTSFFAVLMGSFLIALIFQPLRDKIQALVDKLFFKSKYDYSQELSKISSQITSNLSLDNILHTLQRAFSDVMRVSHSQIYLPKDFDLPEIKGLTSLRKTIMKEEALVLPCITEGRMVALIVLGKKMSEDPYREEDLRLLRNLADQAAVALDHARIYEENLKAEKQLLLADKLSSMGRVAAGLAHEIKNPLTAIKGMTQALERNPGDQETIKDFNAIIPKEVDRLTRLVENLSNLGKAPKFQLTKVDIKTLLENNLKLFESRCRKQGINIVKELGTIPEIETDGERLTQVFTNLILNAIQAMPEGGVLRLRTSDLGHRTIEIEISDIGCGIPQDKLKDIFEPFFTTKEEGTGLGLAITHKIIKDLGGEIKVESAINKGTKFRIELPVN